MMKAHEGLLGGLVAALLGGTLGLHQGLEDHEQRTAQEIPGDLEATLELLVDEIPLGYEVHLEMGPSDSELWGEAWWDDDAQRYEIRIDPRAPWRLQKETLVHEYAHCRVFDTESGHGPFWGVAYAEAYRVVYD